MSQKHTAERRQRRYLGTPAIAERYGRALRTIQRWLVDPPPGFPKPRKHNGRWIFAEDELDEYDESLARSDAEAA